MGKSTINGPFSIAMLVYQRVITEPIVDPCGKFNHQPSPISPEIAVLNISTYLNPARVKVE